MSAQYQGLWGSEGYQQYYRKRERRREKIMTHSYNAVYIHTSVRCKCMWVCVLKHALSSSVDFSFFPIFSSPPPTPFVVLTLFVVLWIKPRILCMLGNHYQWATPPARLLFQFTKRSIQFICSAVISVELRTGCVWFARLSAENEEGCGSPGCRGLPGVCIPFTGEARRRNSRL